jgi:hypothetical protein
MRLPAAHDHILRQKGILLRKKTPYFQFVESYLTSELFIKPISSAKSGL